MCPLYTPQFRGCLLRCLAAVYCEIYTAIDRGVTMSYSLTTKLHSALGWLTFHLIYSFALRMFSYTKLFVFNSSVWPVFLPWLSKALNQMPFFCHKLKLWIPYSLTSVLPRAVWKTKIKFKCMGTNTRNLNRTGPGALPGGDHALRDSLLRTVYISIDTWKSISKLASPRQET